MKMYWEVLNAEKKLYTGKAVKYIIDKQSKKTYYTGNGRLYKQNEYPRSLAENSPEKYDFCYGEIPRPTKEQKGFFGVIRQVYSNPHPQDLEQEYLHLFGLWKIENLNLYTNKAVDYIRDKQTKKEYKRGERILFRNEDTTPFPLAEHTNKYDFIYEMDDSSNLTTNDYLREISVFSFFKK